MIGVAIVEDHPVFREGLSGLVEDAPDLVLIAATRSVTELDVELDRGHRPDVIVLDLSLTHGGPQGGDAVAHVCRRGLRALVLSASATKATVIEAMAAGAAGYLSKEAEPAEILRAIHTVASGGSFIAPTLAGYLLDSTESIKLTTREVEILRLVAAGERDHDIAAELFISVHTVHSHLDRIRAKTGHHRRVDLTRFAIARGIVANRSDHRSIP